MRGLKKVGIGIFSSAAGILLALGIRTATLSSRPTPEHVSLDGPNLPAASLAPRYLTPGAFTTASHPESSTTAGASGVSAIRGALLGESPEPYLTTSSQKSLTSSVSPEPRLPGPSTPPKASAESPHVLTFPQLAVGELPPRISDQGETCTDLSQHGADTQSPENSPGNWPRKNLLRKNNTPPEAEVANAGIGRPAMPALVAEPISPLPPRKTEEDESGQNLSRTAGNAGTAASSPGARNEELAYETQEDEPRQPFEQGSRQAGLPLLPAQGEFTADTHVRIFPIGRSGQPTAPESAGTAPPNPPGKKLIIEVQNEDIRKVLQLLARHSGTSILLSKSVQGPVTASLHAVDLHTALEALLRATGYVARRYEDYIFVGTTEECDRFDQLRSGLGLRVYRPRFVSAKELESLFRPLLTAGIGTVTVSSPAETGISGDPTRTGGDSYAGGDLVIVRDYENVLTQLDQLVAEIDVKPPQVAIEAMILAVRLDDEDRIGINFELFRDKPRFRLGWENPPASLANIRFDAGLKVAFLDGSVSSFVSALQQIRDTNVIAAPRLLVLNKHRADIQIGKEQGYVSTTITETAASQSVEFLQTGTLLRIRPFVTGDNMIRLEVHPELSDGEVRELAGFTVPQKDITQVTTNVLVPNGSTVVIGGLIRRELSSGGSQIPVLGNLPWVGAIFRNRSAQQIREEIIVLITPHIIRDEEAAREAVEASERFERHFAVASEFATPLGRQNVAKRFCRLAQAAWNRGDLPRARRMAELALHFDPTLEEALAIREAIARETMCRPHNCPPTVEIFSSRQSSEAVSQPPGKPGGEPGVNPPTPQMYPSTESPAHWRQNQDFTTEKAHFTEITSTLGDAPTSTVPTSGGNCPEVETLPPPTSPINPSSVRSQAVLPLQAGRIPCSGQAGDFLGESSVVHPVYWWPPSRPVLPSPTLTSFGDVKIPSDQIHEVTRACPLA